MIIPTRRLIKIIRQYEMNWMGIIMKLKIFIQSLVYYKSFTDRSDQLIGVATFDSRTDKPGLSF